MSAAATAPVSGASPAAAPQQLQVYVDGIGALGPGFANWEQARAALAGTAPAAALKTVVPPAAALPPAERRRAGLAVKTVLAVGQQALDAAGVPVAQLATVFSSSGGDGVNCHEICAALASADRTISPTRFHNSVHNAPSGYWSIATGAMATSSVLCAFDGSFCAGLLEAMAQVVVQQRPVLLLVYDTDYPQPLYGVRPIPDTMGVGLLLSPRAGSHSVAQLLIDPAAPFSAESAHTLADPVLEPLRQQIPAARGLPLLQALAQPAGQSVRLDYLAGQQLVVQVTPC